MTKLGKLLGVLLALALLAAACGDSDDGSGTTPATDAPTAATDAPAETIELSFWHAMADDLGAVVDGLVDEYNNSQSAVHVTATFQGSYDDTYNALLAGFSTDEVPNIVQNFDIASQTMFDTGRLVPASALMGPGDSDLFIPAVRDYYSDENGMVAMAFNSSTPIVYFNKDIFDAAGLPTPDKDWTFDDFVATCDALEAAGTEFCVTFGQVGWYFEQINANSGGLYFNNDNGRTGRADAAVFNDGQGVEVFEFLTGLIQDGHAPNLGNTWTDTDAVFFAGEAAMIFDSTSGAGGMQDNSDFEVSTAYIPHSNSSDRNGVVIGGAALWLIDANDAAINDAAWDFMSFMAGTDQQVTWHVGTGYFPVRADLQASPTPALTEFWDANPNFVTAINQLSDTKTLLDDGTPNYPVLGGRAGPFPDIRRLIVEAYAAVLNDGASPQDALDDAAEKADALLADYNEFVE